MVAAKEASSKKSKAAAMIKSPKTPKADKTAKKAIKVQKEHSKEELLKTGLNSALVEKAAEALIKYHESKNTEKQSLLGTDQSIQVQFTLLRAPESTNHKPVRIMIPHPLYQLKTEDGKEANGNLEEPEVCLIVKEESKPWCQELIERFPEHMGCVKKVLGLQSLRTKHARYEQRRALLHKYNVFMADDRILPMLSKALGTDFYKAKKLPIPITLTRKEALPFAIQKALSSTYMSISKGTCIMIRAGNTSMSPQQLAENIVEIANGAVPKMPRKWANVQNIAIKTPESVALPVYSKTPEVLREIAVKAGLVETIDEPEKEKDKETTASVTKETKDVKKREMKSPLLKALKKQKKEEKTKTTKESEETPKQKKRRSLSEDSTSKKVESIEKVAKKTKADKEAEAETPTPKVTKKSKDEAESAKKSETKDKQADSSEEKKDFIVSKKFKGSKQGYVFRMGKQGLGYYVDIKPVVDRMAMDALMRAAKGKGKKGGPTKNKRKGGRRF